MPAYTYTRPAAEVEVEYDPAQKAAAGRKGSATRHDPRTYAKSIVKKWPALDDQVRAELAAILSPVLGRVEASR